MTATDLVLTVTQMLRKKGVVGKFVEFYGPGLDDLSLADRATIANMAPEYGATCGFFPVDAETHRLSARPRAARRRASRWSRHTPRRRACSAPRRRHDPVFTDTLELDLGDVVPSLAGPKRPAGPRRAARRCRRASPRRSTNEYQEGRRRRKRVPVEGKNFDLGHGDVVIAAITSCTNTSNPCVLIGAGLLARNAVAQGPEGEALGEDLARAGQPGGRRISRQVRPAEADLDKLGFNLVGYGCTTCIGNSGPLPEAISKAINDNDIVAAAVLSGNRNFEGRVNPDVRANYLASPPLVVAYALAGTMTKRPTNEPLGHDKDGKPVYLKDIWPTTEGDRRLSCAST